MGSVLDIIVQKERMAKDIPGRCFFTLSWVKFNTTQTTIWSMANRGWYWPPRFKSSHVLVDFISIANKLYSPFWTRKDKVDYSTILASFCNIFRRCKQFLINKTVETAVEFLLMMIFQEMFRFLCWMWRVWKCWWYEMVNGSPQSPAPVNSHRKLLLL